MFELITRTCKICGKTFTLPENVQHWPDCCQECRAKYQPVENITRKCRKCGKTFTFPSNAPRWPKYCPECQKKRENMAQKEYISIHGPEHHILDGACILTAFYNAGGIIRLEESLNKIAREGLRMPGAMCGLWGICGAIASVGAALSIIDGTGPLSDDGTWGEHMKFTSQAIGELGKINGPRCCKRDAMIAFREGVRYINEHYSVALEYEDQQCEFSERNQQCLKERCPFFKRPLG